MDISQLRYFLKIAEHRSFTRAAEDCKVSQPALSQQISRLEEELGCPVFDRRGRSVELTEAGKRLRERAARIVALADDAAREVKDDGQTGHVTIAAIPTIAPYFLPGLLADFRGELPEARVEVYEEVTASLLRRCASGEVDVGVLAMPVSAQYLEIEPLFEEELLAVVPATHELARRETIALAELVAEPFLLLGEAHCLSGTIQAVCQQQAIQPIGSGRMSQLATIQQLVSLGQGVSLIPEMAARVDASPSRVYRRLEEPVPRRTIAACWNAYRYQTRLARNVLDRLRSIATSAGANIQPPSSAAPARARSSSRRKQS
jgi:LysR family hydrogen peroxide-inducible transcriptional activator